MRRRAKSLFFGLASLAILLVGIQVAQWMFFPVNVLEVKVQPLPLVKNKLHAGEDIAYIVDYCKRTPSKAYIYTTLIGEDYKKDHRNNGEIVYESFLPAGCGRFTSDRIQVSHDDNLVIGKEYYLDISAVYHINPIKPVITRLNTEKFTYMGENL